MAHNLRFRKENLQIPEKINESRFLLSGHGVARLALLIEPSLIADADRASIVRTGMSPHLQQLTVLRHRTILSKRLRVYTIAVFSFVRIFAP